VLGKFKVDDAKWRHFSDKVMEIDSEAVFSRNDPLVMQHSTCRAFLHLEEPYQPGPFKSHVHKCDVKLKVLRKDTMTLNEWVIRNPSGNSKARVSLCSGLKANMHMQLQVLLSLPTNGVVVTLFLLLQKNHMGQDIRISPCHKRRRWTNINGLARRGDMIAKK